MESGTPPKPPDAALARWAIVQQLGKSGQSCTWKVKQRASDQLGVLKAPHVQPAQLTRLRREINILLKIEHPAIARPLDAEPDDNDPWLVTPLGIPLNEWWPAYCARCSTNERFEQARKFALSLADGLRAVHERGVVHRDLKPENVIVIDDDDGARPLLIDFGVAFVREEPRLTEIDGRAVRNKFVSPPEAYYRPLADPPAWWDCLGLAWVWAWMIGDMDLGRRFRFHWKYHPLIPHPKAERFRALLASCNSEVAGPTNGRDFISLAERLGLGDATMEPREPPGDDFEAARLAASAASADHQLHTAERIEAVEASVAVLGVIYDELYAVLDRVVAASRLPLRLAREWDESSAATLNRLGADDEQAVTLFRVIGTRPSGDFEITLNASYQPLPSKYETLPFVFTLQPHNAFEIAWNSVVHRRDGTPLLAGQLSPLPLDHFVSLVKNHITQQALWKPDII